MEMFGELNLIFFLEFYIVFNEISPLIPWSKSFWALFVFQILVLLVFFAKLGLVEKCHLNCFEVRYQFFLLVQIDLLEIGAILMCSRDIRSDLIEIRSRYQWFYLIQQLIYLHISRKTRIHLHCRFKIWLIRLSTKDYLKHRVEDHLRLLSHTMA